ncbi:MAG: hypothetical protein KDE59_23795 [Anaerolineales bacterium]|nr:hypothetical protein [Anaerolineales bacterium]
MRRNYLVILLSMVVIVAGLASCGGADDPAATVEAYLEAKATGDEAALGALLCSEQEVNLQREVHTFDSVTGVELVDMACSYPGSGDIVSCDGKFVALYGSEETEFPLVSYRVVQEDGQWKWCGEGAAP